MSAAITRVSRCLISGKAVLMGFDQHGKEVFGLSGDNRDPVKWACRGVADGDKARLIRAYEQYLQELEKGGPPWPSEPLNSTPG